MAAVRRSSGKGTVIALVVFIVLAFAGIGVSIWLYQQKTIVQQAAGANQQYFRREIGSVFDEQGWDLDRRVEAPYGMEYGEDAYSQVRGKLQDAAMLEKMGPELGWNNYQSLHEALVNSPVQRTGEHQYETLRGLFNYYEEEYQRLTDRVAELSRQLQTTQNQLADKSQAMTEMQNRLEKELNDAVQKHQESIAKLRQQYEDMQQMYQNTRQELQSSQTRFDRAEEDWEQNLNNLEEQVSNWKQAYELAVRGPDRKSVV